MAKKSSKSRKSDPLTTRNNLERRLKKAQRLNKSEAYIKDLETAISKIRIR